VVWEVVVLGHFDEVIEILQNNVAMAWMLLPLVEGLFRSEGGLGALISVENKHFNLSAEFAIVFLILFVGLLQDYLIGTFKRIVCPYSDLGLERA
jgi:NitT/TauT family transport system permease protein